MSRLQVTKKDEEQASDAVADTSVGFANCPARYRAWDRLALVFAKAREYGRLMAEQSTATPKTSGDGDVA